MRDFGCKAQPGLDSLRARVARSVQEKMILIDTLIHRYHWELEGGLSGPGARDLIGGKPNEIIDFLNNLSYGS
ncbi:MAG: hypothetical protein OXI23_17485, partial [Gemmatimonadota bacterium]|nr:hypothetical protein [Gemmatimonadota bacterium]